VSPQCRLSQAFGVSLHPQAKPQRVFSSGCRIWLLTRLRRWGHSRLVQCGGPGAWPQRWLPPWLRPELGDVPARPTLQRVVTPAPWEVTLKRCHPVTPVLQPLWHPAHRCTLCGGCRRTVLLLAFLPAAGTPRAPLPATSTPEGGCAGGGIGGFQHHGGERQLGPHGDAQSEQE